MSTNGVRDFEREFASKKLQIEKMENRKTLANIAADSVLTSMERRPIRFAIAILLLGGDVRYSFAMLRYNKPLWRKEWPKQGE